MVHYKRYNKTSDLLYLLSWRVTYDMIEVFKYLGDMYSTSKPHGLDQALGKSADTRGHSKKLSKNPQGIQVRSSFFSERVFEYWNSLPEVVVSAPSLNAFKRGLDTF